MPDLPYSWRWSLWLALLAVWTVGLLVPDPLKRGTPQTIDLSLSYFISKLAHLGVYGVLAATAAFLSSRPSWWLLALLAGHAALSEWLQGFVPTRFGSATDVLIDLAGIALGVALTWRRWLGKNPPPPQ